MPKIRKRTNTYRHNSRIAVSEEVHSLARWHRPEDESTIELPLCPNPLDRPRQMVDTQYGGKPAITYYQVLERTDKYTRIAFIAYPIQGRTHQLRVHAAHPSGLHCPIMGGLFLWKKDKRLYLHAESIEFIHPVNGQSMCITKKQTSDYCFFQKLG